MLLKILRTIIKPLTIKIPKPWDKVCLIIILSYPVYVLLVVLQGFISYFILAYYLDGPTIGWEGFLILPFATFIVLLLHHTLSKTKSVPRLIRWSVTLIFLEVLVYIWFRALGTEHLFNTEGGVGDVLTAEDKLEIILRYVKALCQTAILTLMLVVSCLFIKQK